MRIDKWIWAVRMAKTRTQAGTLCKKGKVLLNGQAVRPSRTVKPGDQIEVDTGSRALRYEVVGLIATRVGADKAAEYFKDVTPPELTQRYTRTPLDGVPPLIAPASRERGEGRPTKKQRRDMEKFLKN